MPDRDHADASVGHGLRARLPELARYVKLCAALPCLAHQRIVHRADDSDARNVFDSARAGILVAAEDRAERPQGTMASVRPTASDARCTLLCAVLRFLFVAARAWSFPARPR